MLQNVTHYILESYSYALIECGAKTALVVPIEQKPAGKTIVFAEDAQYALKQRQMVAHVSGLEQILHPEGDLMMICFHLAKNCPFNGEDVKPDAQKPRISHH